ncbi:MAG: serine/threonine-protein kinase [bacterium]
MTKRLTKGSRLGKYRLEKRLGEGGSATVWQARDTIEGRRAALKIVAPEVVTEFGRDAVENEARIAAQLDHPRVVSIRNADWIEGHFVLVTDLARTSLDLYAGARRSPALALSILLDVAEGLAYAHGQGLIHRDIKPANILIYEGRRAKLGDFGTARLAPQGTSQLTEVGTFGYMAPEHAYGRPGYASDVFSLSLTAYQILSGRLPTWPFEWPLEGHERFERRCPEPVAKVIRKGLRLALASRWRDGIELHRALVRALAGSAGVASRRAHPPTKDPGRRSRNASDPFSLETDWFRERFGAVFEAHFDCCTCDGPIAESMSFCPWCGTTRNSFIEVTGHPLVCPDCERGVRPEWKACPRCPTGRFVSNGKPIPADPHATRSCARPGCRTPLRPFMRYCPACKRKVSRPWRVAGLPRCTRCRWAIGPRWRFCGWCGKRNATALDVSVRGRRRRPT